MKKPIAIVYTSNTGHTEAYAKLLAKKCALPIYSMKEAQRKLPKKSPIIYMGWLMASHIKGYRQAKKRYQICVLCGVGLCPTGALLDEIRNVEKLAPDFPLFTLQGGMDYEHLHGIDKIMIDMLVKMLSAKKEPSEQDREMLALIQAGGNYVSEENLSAILQYLQSV